MVLAGIRDALGSRIDPIEWRPPDPPEMEGALARNRELAGLDTVVACDGPEDVAFDGSNRLYTGVEDGRVLRTVDPVDDDTTEAAVETFARTDGRPLGMSFDGGELLVAAESAGLLAIDSAGSVRTLTDSADGRHTAFADDLHVDGEAVYFTDATRHDLFQDELFELRDTGRLLAYHRDTGETTVELADLGFANGVAPGPDGDSLLVTETSRYRITRYWPDSGESEPFVENLPGYPDNIDAEGDGTHWVAVPSLRDDTLERLHRHPWVKRQLGRFPESVLGSIEGDDYGLVLRFDDEGKLVESLHDPEGDVFGVTSATPHEGALYLGSLFGERVVRYPR